MINRLTVLAFCLALSACSQPGPDPAGASATTEANTSPAHNAGAAGRVAPVSEPNLRVEPAELSSCKDQSVLVVWDTSNDADNESMEIWVGSSQEIKRFAAGGSAGNKETGPWARPGTEFQLRRTGQDEVVASAVVGGPRCE